MPGKGRSHRSCSTGCAIRAIPRPSAVLCFRAANAQTGCQFSYTCDGSLRRKPSRFHWNRAGKVATAALAGKMASPVGTATHYHTTEIYPYWAPSLRFLGHNRRASLLQLERQSPAKPARSTRSIGDENPFPRPIPAVQSPARPDHWTRSRWKTLMKRPVKRPKSEAERQERRRSRGSGPGPQTAAES